MSKKLVFNKVQTREKDLRKIFYLYSIVKKEYEESVENNNQTEYTALLKTLENKIWSHFQKVLMGNRFVVLHLAPEEANLLPNLLSEELENIKQTPIGILLNSISKEVIQNSVNDYIDIAEKFSLILEIINELNDNQ